MTRNEPTSHTTTSSSVMSWLLRSGVLLAVYKGALLARGASGHGATDGDQRAGNLIGTMLVTLAALGLITLPIVVVRSLPDFFAFLRGAEPYRKKWLNLQLNAWAMTIGCFILAYGIIHGQLARPLIESFAFSSVGSLMAGVAFYLAVMSRMPDEFFLRDRIGNQVMKFLGCHEVEKVSLYCLASAVFILAISMGVVVALVLQTH